jgi:hypothetical protein
MKMPLRPERILLALFSVLSLAACSGFAKGVTEAILESSEKEDTRLCHIEGPPSLGLAQVLEAQDQTQGTSPPVRELKVLMVHGIGRHLPGYSGRLTESLMPALGLTSKSDRRKEIVLWEPAVSEEPVGKLSIHLYLDPERSRRLVFYELTWSDVIEAERQAIAFDNSKEYAFRRTELNGYMKQFFNDHVPDAFIYMSDARAKIFASVQQGVCWMTTGDWEDLPDQASQRCDPQNPVRAVYARQDDFAFVTHSLGSRIAIDVLQDETGLVVRPEGETHQALMEVFRERELPIYMLSNQLPLLGLGLPPPSARHQTANYCAQDAISANQRALKSLDIYAFSDPNDLLSYPIPPDLARRYVDSRLCPSVTNISINVAKPVDLLGISQVANPVAAHGAYDGDDRVIDIMAHGVGQGAAWPDLAERCSWIETVEVD